MNRPRWLLSSSEFNFLHPVYWFGNVDARPLGLFRIAFAALMLKEAVYHIFVAEIWYSDAGMLPLRLLPSVSPGTPTLMSGLNATWMAMAFFVVWAVVALLLLFGWQTRVMSILNLVLLVSVVNRNQMVVTGADNVMQVLAFWSLFVPLGRCYSVDARRRPPNPHPTTYAFPVRMLQIQIALIYIFTVIFKLQGQTWPNGDALYMAMQIKMHTFPVADWLLANVSISVLRTFTFMALLVEVGFAVLIFAPILQPYLRRVGLVAGVLLHVGIGLVMNIPNFPLVMIMSYLLLIDSGWTDWIDRHLQINATSPQATNVVIPSPVQKAQSGCLGVLLAVPRGIIHGSYRGILACVLLAVMVFVIWGNFLTNDLLAIRLNVPAMPSAVEANLRAVGLWQSWALFAPDPLSYEGWFGVNGIFSDGQIYDIRGGYERPHWYSGPLARWGKLEENLMTKPKDDPLFSAWAAYICQQHPFDGLTGVQIVLYSRATSAPGQPFLPYQTTVLLGASCQPM
ncbi:MAG: HTTM domain-containing protein [Anaerolineae bacterium]|nr:HTTM domain-containing protein [Anaerolineae bacterium]